MLIELDLEQGNNLMNKEIWKTIRNFPDYMISNMGRIKGLKSTNRWKSGRILESQKKRGYLVVGLTNDYGRKRILIHRLVYENFIKLIKLDMEINHIDGDKKNNCVVNLEEVTPSENIRKAIDIGLIKKGEEYHASKLKDIDIKLILIITNSEEYKLGKINQEVISKFFGVTQENISDIKNRKTWKHIKIENRDNLKILLSEFWNSEIIKNFKRNNNIGENNPSVKLKKEDVINIKIELKEKNLNQKQIAEKYNIDVTTISKINTGKLWSHV